MTQEHPITPPEELVDQWNEAWIDAKVKHEGLVTFIATQAARWGADQELEACCKWMLANARFLDAGWIERLRAARRPKPPSLKEQALALLDDASDRLDAVHENIIRRALEQLDG
jgi:hypothetical protein